MASRPTPIRAAGKHQLITGPEDKREIVMITPRARNQSDLTPTEVRIPCASLTLEGALAVPTGAAAIVIFAHGSGNSRQSSRNQFVARVIGESGYGTLLFDLLTAEEEIEDNMTRYLRFDIAVLASRLVKADVVARWASRGARCRHRLFLGRAPAPCAALVVAAEIGQRVEAVVSRGGRPDLAWNALARVKSPTAPILKAIDSDATIPIHAPEQKDERNLSESNEVGKLLVGELTR